jgi:hypothetical protein
MAAKIGIENNFLDKFLKRGGLHPVVSHKSFFGNQEIRQLEL